MTFEQALEAWARKNHPILEGRDVTNISVEHNEGYQNDMTYWEAETIVTVRTRKIGPKGQKHYKTFQLWASTHDPLEFARELFDVAGEESPCNCTGLDHKSDCPNWVLLY